MGESELTVYEEQRNDLQIARAPELVLAEAKKAAHALSDVIANKKKPVIFNGEQYLEFEDWQTVGRFYGVTAKIVSTEFVDFGAAKGFLARAVALRPDGLEISAAEAMCLDDEPNWNKKPLFQLRSMAQTRACAKALRNVLAWVVVLAGYKATPAEEMQDVASGKSSVNQPGEKGATSSAKIEGDKVTGTVEDVTIKTGKGKNGDWTKYGIKVGGAFYGTFDKTMGEAAIALKGKEAVITFTNDGKYNTATAIEGKNGEAPTSTTSSGDPEGCTQSPSKCEHSVYLNAGEPDEKVSCGEFGPACKYKKAHAA